MAKPPTTLATAQRPRTQGVQSELAIVDGPRDTHPICQPYLTTSEAARYLHRSISWLLRCGEIPYVPGRPNLYAIKDLDTWFESNKHIPRS
jgi:hypothetical protein